MTHPFVYEEFKTYFPQYEELTDLWFPNGKNSIRVRLKNKRELVFTINGTRDWCFETVDSYLKRMGEKYKGIKTEKGGQKM